MNYKSPRLISSEISFDKNIVFERENPESLKTVKLANIKLKIAGTNIFIMSHEGVPPRKDISEKTDPFLFDFENPDIILNVKRNPDIFRTYPYNAPPITGKTKNNKYIFESAVGNIEFNPETQPLYVTGFYKNTLEDLLGMARIALAHYLLYNGYGALFHASSVYSEEKKESAVFLGISGAGKTTAALNSPGTILSDEVSAVLFGNGKYYLTGTPFGTRLKPSIITGKNIKFYFIVKSEFDKIEPLKPGTAWKNLFSSLIAMPLNNEFLEKSMDFLEILSKEVPFYNLYATKEGGFWSKILKWS